VKTSVRPSGLPTFRREGDLARSSWFGFRSTDTGAIPSSRPRSPPLRWAHRVAGANRDDPVISLADSNCRATGGRTDALQASEVREENGDLLDEVLDIEPHQDQVSQSLRSTADLGVDVDEDRHMGKPKHPVVELDGIESPVCLEGDRLEVFAALSRPENEPDSEWWPRTRKDTPGASDRSASSVLPKPTRPQPTAVLSFS
jgi:hypothetical protein